MKSNLKKTTGILILSVLALAMFSMLISTSVKADSSEAQILSYSWYVAPADTALATYAGDLVIVGEVQNVGSNIIGYMDVTGVVYDSNGTVLNSNEAQVFGNNLLPGQKAPFYIDFAPEDSITQDQSYISSVSSVAVSVGYVSDTNSTPYSGLTVASSTSYVDSSGTYTVTGTIQNSGTEEAGNVLVVTTFYNSTGAVASLNFTDYLSDSFGPGDSVPFTATPTDNTVTLSSQITNYSLLIQSQPITSSPTPVPTPTPTEQPNSSPTATPITGQPSSSSILIYVIVGVVIVVVVIASLIFLRRRRNLPPPPPPPAEEQQESANFS